MKRWQWIAAVAGVVIVAAVMWITLSYRSAISRAEARIAGASRIAQTACGPIEYAVRGEGPPVLGIHGAGGGFDQTLSIGSKLRGMTLIAPSRFGYLRTPLPADASPEKQADAHACLLDALHVDKVSVIAVSAGGPSAMQFCLRHPSRCSALVLLVPLAWAPGPAFAERRAPPRAQQWVMEYAFGSDFAFWAGTRLFHSAMVEAILGTPMADIRDQPRDVQEQVFAVLDEIQPIHLRQAGLRNEMAIGASLRRYELEKISAPTLVASVKDCGYGTYEPAKYTAEHIPGARFIGYERGGHLWVGHQEELFREVNGFLREAAGLPVQ